MKTDELIKYGLIAAAVYVGWLYFSGGARKVTAPIADAIAWWWTLDDAPGVGGALGNVIYPNGTTKPIAGMSLKQDSAGRVYVQSGGQVFQLQPSNANGDWPAILVTGS